MSEIWHKTSESHCCFTELWIRIYWEPLPYMTFRSSLACTMCMLDVEARRGICRNERSAYKEQSLFISTAKCFGDQSESNTKIEVHSLPLRHATGLFWNQRKLLASPLSEPTRWNVSRTATLPPILCKCETWSVTLIEKFWWGLCEHSWSQWPRGIRHELSSLAQTLESWVRILLKA
jgi:hypothetical protein